MASLKHIVDGKLLGSVVSLPESFLNIKLEITITPTVSDHDKTSLTRNKLRSLLKGSVTESLSGSLPHTDMTLEDLRAERLNRFERLD
jgi:hypothetical protein